MYSALVLPCSVALWWSIKDLFVQCLPPEPGHIPELLLDTAVPLSEAAPEGPTTPQPQDLPEDPTNLHSQPGEPTRPVMTLAFGCPVIICSHFVLNPIILAILFIICIPKLVIPFLFCFFQETSGNSVKEEEEDEEQRWERERKVKQEQRQRELEEAKEREWQEVERLEKEMVTC